MEHIGWTDLFGNGWGATFSKDRKYRYALWRIWDSQKPKIMFIGLNPSTADEIKNDPTIYRVQAFSKHWGFGGVYMMNLFAWVTSYPNELSVVPDPVGENDRFLEEISAKCARVLFCWGAFPQAKERASEIISKYPDAYVLKVNSDGSPGHPLYLPGNTLPKKYAQLIQK